VPQPTALPRAPGDFSPFENNNISDGEQIFNSKLLGRERERAGSNMTHCCRRNTTQYFCLFISFPVRVILKLLPAPSYSLVATIRAKEKSHTVVTILFYVLQK
jgi:hypothetical protein